MEVGSFPRFRRVRIPFRVENEAATRYVFDRFHDKLGYKVLYARDDCPDYSLEDTTGKKIEAQAEHYAHAFKEHGHPTEGIGLIICWADDWPDSPIPKLVLRKYFQEKPHFDGFKKGELSREPKPPRKSKQLTHIIDELQKIGGDLASLIESDGETNCWNWSLTMERMMDNDCTLDMVTCSYKHWTDDSEVILTIDFISSMLEVRGILKNEVIKRHEVREWRSILRRVSKNGYMLKQALKENGSGKPTNVSAKNALFREIADGEISSMVLARGYRSDEILYDEPYDVVARLHEELCRMLDLMEREELYVRKEAR
nr:hypothetical protein [Candidatus Njordarchaeota archaeon]